MQGWVTFISLSLLDALHKNNLLYYVIYQNKYLLNIKKIVIDQIYLLYYVIYQNKYLLNMMFCK